MEKLRIFYVFYHSYEYLPIHACDVIEELVEQKHEVFLITSVNQRLLDECSWKDKVKIFNIPIINKRILNKVSYSLQLILLLPLLSIIKRPALIYERTSITTVITAILSQLFRIFLITEVNGISIEELKYSKQSLWRIRLAKLYETISYRNSKLVVAVTNTIKKYLIKTYQIDKKKIKVLPNGTNVRRFYPVDTCEARNYFNLAKDKKYVGYLGTLSSWCGVDLIIDAAPLIIKKYPDIKILIGGGEEPFFSLFQKEVKRKRLNEYFSFYGTIPWQDANLFIGTFDIAMVCLAGYPISGSPQKLYAYMACNKAVIGSDVGEIGIVLRRHKSGLVFDPGNAESIAINTLELLNNQDMCEQMGRRGGNAVDKNYSWAVKVEDLLKDVEKRL
ncbi:MAG: glycosyltransferase family 4 protein [Desulfobacteraceae bacterium]|nr:glycosyltransferase family 4 protein [Desulfobacteraceae bacterium]